MFRSVVAILAVILTPGLGDCQADRAEECEAASALQTAPSTKDAHTAPIESAPDKNTFAKKSTIEEIRAAFEEHAPEQTPGDSQEVPEGQSRGWPWSRSETCCMCSYDLRHLGTLLYAAEDYDHDEGAHNAQWQCQQSCRDQCNYRGKGDFFGCYDENHLRQMQRDYGHEHGFQIWQEKKGHIC